MTDSLCSFCPLITPPKNIKKQIKFPFLFKQTQKILKNNKIILWKIKSHTDKINIIDNYYGGFPRVQPHNHFADRLADKGRDHPQNKEGLPLYLKKIPTNHYYHNTRCLDGANNFNIVRQFWLRRIYESEWPD